MRYEIFIKDYLPTIRAMIAKNLINYGLTQQEVANKLYLTQPAIAFYKKNLRGKKIEELEKKEEIRNKVAEVAKKLITKNLKEDEVEKEYIDIFNLLKL